MLILNKFFDQFRKYTWLKSIAFIILGLFSLLQPASMLNIFINVTAGFVAFFGILNLISAFRQRKAYQRSFNLPIGISQLVGAGLILLLSKPILSALPFLLGISLGVSGIAKIVDAFSHRQYINVRPTPFILYGIVMIILGLVLVFNPFNTILLALRIFGAALLFNAIMNIFTARKLKA
ncbi:HdeD family acid-resistance protein [Agrilactobacillus yilanensis]|uniref:HdeD family acid-resistance protein n=1 Tax=Agrilactobacillus yilanensis TaxID=2485997 RepID=A0ABW4J4C3_9LACO